MSSTYQVSFIRPQSTVGFIPGTLKPGVQSTTAGKLGTGGPQQAPCITEKVAAWGPLHLQPALMSLTNAIALCMVGWSVYLNAILRSARMMHSISQ